MTNMSFLQSRGKNRKLKNKIIRTNTILKTNSIAVIHFMQRIQSQTYSTYSTKKNKMNQGRNRVFLQMPLKCILISRAMNSELKCETDKLITNKKLDLFKIIRAQQNWSQVVPTGRDRELQRPDSTTYSTNSASKES